jgi:hypothetical protein
MVPMADQLIVRRWLLDLGRLTAARSSHDEAADFIETSTPMLAMRFQNEAFNPASLEHVAAECKYLPTYGELVPLLREWWRQHRPQPVALPAPPVRGRGEPTAEEIAHVTWVAAQARAALRSDAQPIGDRRPRVHYLTTEQLAQAYRTANIVPPRAVGAVLAAAKA